MDFSLHEKDLWATTLGELLPLEVEFQKIVSRRSILEHRLFKKKDKLVYGTVLLNVVDFLLHHVALSKTTKDAWDNLCATLEKKHVDNKLQLYQELYNLKMEEGTSMQVHIDKFWMIGNQLTNIDHQVSDEDFAFTLLGNLSSSFTWYPH
jgi:hypothetical protein